MRALRCLLAPPLLLALAGCDLSMTQQAKRQAQSGDTLWPGGTKAGVPDGAVAQDQPARNAALATPPSVTPALLARGQDRYRVFCTPCHAEDGGGEGRVIQRGFPRPPAFGAADNPRRTVAAITSGYGVMFPFADRIDPADRWAIAAYVEALKQYRREQHP